jgi:hypothetical protein
MHQAVVVAKGMRSAAFLIEALTRSTTLKAPPSHFVVGGAAAPSAMLVDTALAGTFALTEPYKPLSAIASSILGAHRTTTVTAACLDERRCDLDLLRIAAFGLLILHHLGTVFVKWDFHIKTAHPAKWVEVRMLLSSASRLPLLFLISGAASWFPLAQSGGALYFASSRSWRLLWPLLFAVVNRFGFAAGHLVLVTWP